MKIQTDAANVLQRASAQLKSGLLKEKPLWYDIIAKYPPTSTNDLIKKSHVYEGKSDPRNNSIIYKYPNSSSSSTNKSGGGVSSTILFKTRPLNKELKSKNHNIHKLPKLKFIEDSLRKIFYQQHPWELSRPKNLIDNDNGNNNEKCDWSHMLQLYKPLDGESVVQRTLWLLKNNDIKKLSMMEAYDKARFEFYKLRMQEEMESHVSKEESSMYGSVFTSTTVNWNLFKEQEYINDWTIIAKERTQVIEANMNKSSAPIGSVVEEEKSQSSLFEDLLLNDNLQSEIEQPEQPEQQQP